MNTDGIRKLIETEGGRLLLLYSDIPRAQKRLVKAVDTFASLYGEEGEVALFSVPGRSEICGNHTDHNSGCVLAGAIDRDVIAVVRPRTDGVIRLKSEGYDETVIDLNGAIRPEDFENFSSPALIVGVAAGFLKCGYQIGGFDAYTTTEVLKGSGLSSSAAFEVMIGNILNHLYNGGDIDNQEIAKIAQYAENVYFGKPSGLMDQMACAVGGFVYIDFMNNEAPEVVPIDFSLQDRGYSLCIVNTGGNHADLNEDYASVPGEMKAVASLLGREVLRGVTEADIYARLSEIRVSAGDRALLRAIHFIRENKRVEGVRQALTEGNIEKFLDTVASSGNSSFKYLQNVYTTVNVKEQGLSLALALTEGFIEGKGAAARVHGGGFAGTIQVFLPTELLEEYCRFINGALGEGVAMPLNIRQYGACRIF